MGWLSGGFLLDKNQASCWDGSWYGMESRSQWGGLQKVWQRWLVITSYQRLYRFTVHNWWLTASIAVRINPLDSITSVSISSLVVGLCQGSFLCLKALSLVWYDFCSTLFNYHRSASTLDPLTAKVKYCAGKHWIPVFMGNPPKCVCVYVGVYKGMQ